MAHLKIYRVQPERGATAAYRVEAWLEGKRKDGNEFIEADERVLDEILLGLVNEFDLHPIERPHIWEGSSARTPSFEPRDPKLAKMPMKAYRGRRPHQRKRHPPKNGDSPVSLILGPPGGQISPTQRISCRVPASSQLDVKSGEHQLATRVAGDPISQLTEIILDAESDPTSLVRQLVRSHGGPGNVAVGYIGNSGTWYGVEQLMRSLPEINGSEMAMIVVVEPECIAELLEDTWTRLDGTVDEAAAVDAAGACVRSVDTCTGLFTDALEDLRAHCETTALRVVFVTVDARGPHGLAGRASPFTGSGAIVRSNLGHDGRYWMHTRYRVEGDRIVMLKDERHGRPGTIAWQRSAPAPAW